MSKNPLASNSIIWYNMLLYRKEKINDRKNVHS